MLKVVEQEGEGGNGEGANYRVTISRDGVKIAGFYAGPLQECPEDASLERDLSYAYDAVAFFKIGYEAGKNGEDVTFEESRFTTYNSAMLQGLKPHAGNTGTSA